VDSARARVAELTEQTKKQADNLLKEAELKAKEEQFKKREELEREIEGSGAKSRTAESRRATAEASRARKSADWESGRIALLKKERSVEHSQRKLVERRSEVEKRHQELEALISQQTQLLHQVGNLTREQAEAMLMSGWKKNSPTTSLNASRNSRKACARPARRRRVASSAPPSSATPPSTPPTPRSVRWTFPATT